MFPFNRRGAIFGLDARVALIIFAVLSTITGFVLYQRAEEVQDIKLYASLQEIERGLKLQQRDMGMLPGYAMVDGLGGAGEDQFLTLCSNSLITTGLQKRWKGPYITQHGNCGVDTYKTYSINYYIGYASGQVSSTCQIGNACTACTATGPCYAWIGVWGIPIEETTYINHVVDEGCNSSPGCTNTELAATENGRVVYDVNTEVMWYRTEVKR